jgi:hypothetical protein
MQRRQVAGACAESGISCDFHGEPALTSSRRRASSSARPSSGIRRVTKLSGSDHTVYSSPGASGTAASGCASRLRAPRAR